MDNNSPKKPYPIRLGPSDLAAVEVLATHFELPKQEAIRRVIRAAAVAIANGGGN